MPDPLIPILENIAAELRRREAPGEVVPLRVGELPACDDPATPCLWLDKDGRPHVVLGYQWDGRAYATFSHGTTDLNAARHAVPRPFPDGPTLYPESAAPALWERFLAKQAGRVA